MGFAVLMGESSSLYLVTFISFQCKSVFSFLPFDVRMFFFPLSFSSAVNYRGSTGFGQDSILSLIGQIGSQDVKDVQVAASELCVCLFIRHHFL